MMRSPSIPDNSTAPCAALAGAAGSARLPFHRLYVDEIDAIAAETKFALELDAGTGPFISEASPHMGEGGASTAYYQHGRIVGVATRIRDPFNRTHLVCVDLRPNTPAQPPQVG